MSQNITVRGRRSASLAGTRAAESSAAGRVASAGDGTGARSTTGAAGSVSRTGVRVSGGARPATADGVDTRSAVPDQTRNSPARSTAQRFTWMSSWRTSSRAPPSRSNSLLMRRYDTMPSLKRSQVTSASTLRKFTTSPPKPASSPAFRGTVGGRRTRCRQLAFEHRRGRSRHRLQKGGWTDGKRPCPIVDHPEIGHRVPSGVL